MDIEDEVGDASIGVRDLAKCVRRTVGDEGLGRSPVVTGKEDELGGGTGTKVSELCDSFIMRSRTQLDE